MDTKLNVKIPKLPAHWHAPGCGCEPGVAYIRVSKVGNRQTIISPSLQLDSIVSYAKANNIRLIDLVSDINKSGKTFRKRSIDGIIAKISRGEYRRVVIWKWSRWARNIEESAKYLKLVRNAGGRVDSATEDSDQESAMGRLQMDILMRFDQYQSELLGETWKAVHDRREELGLPHGGRDRFGYQYVSEVVVTDGEAEKVDRYVPIPEQAEALAQAYRDYIGGASFKKIGPRLNDAGFRTTLGGRFTPQGVARMMDTGFAAGLIRGRSCPTETPSNSIKGYDVWRTGSHEPVIDLETWAKFRERRDIQVGQPARLRRPTHELSGMLFCALCRRRMSTKYAGAGRTHQWQCTWQSSYHPGVPVSVNNRLALVVVRDWVRDNAGEEGVNIRAANALKSRAASTAPDRTAIANELARWNRKLDNLIEMKTDGGITKERFEPKNRAYNLEIDRLTAELAAVPAPEGMADIRAFKTLDDEWESFEKQDLNYVLGKLVGMVVVAPRTADSTRKSADDRVEVIGGWESDRLARMQRST